MIGKKIITALLAFILLSSLSLASLEKDWNDFLHYTMIGRFDMAKGYAQSVLQSDPEPVALLELAENNPNGYAILKRVNENSTDEELTGYTGTFLDLIEQGRFQRRKEPRIIAEEIRRLSSTSRGRLNALTRLQNAGEYAIPLMIDALADRDRSEEFSNIAWALPQIGRDAIRPLAAALQTENLSVKTEVIKALGNTGYPQALPYLKYLVENDSSSQVVQLAKENIKLIDPAVMEIPASRLFYQLAERYYYHNHDLRSAEDADFANIWFWDENEATLTREPVAKEYFNELMAMRSCEWALKADPSFGESIGLWLAAYSNAELTGIAMPEYFGADHAPVMVFATTAGPEYLHQALARAVKDKNAGTALVMVEALAQIAGEKSLMSRLATVQPLLEAIRLDDTAVRYSSAIAIANAGPTQNFQESKIVINTLGQALDQDAENPEDWNDALTDEYAIRAAEAILKLAVTRNRHIDISQVQGQLVSAANDDRTALRLLAFGVLAHLDSPNAQRTLANVALDQDNSVDVRIAAFKALSDSAKQNANLLSENQVDAIYSIISSDQQQGEIKSAAASAYGSLNLPSRKVKDLILSRSQS